MRFLFDPRPDCDRAQRCDRCACLAVARSAQRNVLSCWLGADAVAKARRTFVEAGLPSYDTPEDAVYAFLKMEEFRRNQESLMQTPSSAPADFRADVDAVRTIVGKVLDEGREILTEVEAKDVLRIYGIPVVTTRIATSPEYAVRLADEMGFPVALKILSPDVTHKSDVGGVTLNLDSGQAVREAAQAMEARLRRLLPHARLTGFTVQPMAQRPGAVELIVGAATDATFGPVILFGQEVRRGSDCRPAVRCRHLTLRWPARSSSAPGYRGCWPDIASGRRRTWTPFAAY